MCFGVAIKDQRLSVFSINGLVCSDNNVNQNFILSLKRLAHKY